MPAPARKRDSKASRRSIMEAARNLLAQGGGDLEMAWVAREAGVSQGLAYHHFGSKEGLLSAVVDDFYDRVEASVLMARLDEIEGWEPREHERVRRYIEFLLGDPLGHQQEVSGYDLSSNVQFHWLPDGDHSFKPRKKSGRTLDENWADGIAAVEEFVRSLGSI